MPGYIVNTPFARAYRAATHQFLRTFFRLTRRMDVSGVERVPADGPFILAVNHRSHADTAMLFATMANLMRDRVVAAAARDVFFTHSWISRSTRIVFNAVPVERKLCGTKDPLRHVRRALRLGLGVIFYPEGKRNCDEAVATFRSGISRLATAFPAVPIIPVWLEGVDRIFPFGWLLPCRTVTVRFGAPVQDLSADCGGAQRFRAAADKVRAAVVALSETPRKPA